MVNVALEKLVESRVKPLLAEAMQKNLGITVSELEVDISDKLKKSALLEFVVDTKLKFKDAKKKFKREYVAHLLQLNFGNVADVAKIASVDRRSIHRIVAEMKIEVQKFRDIMQKGQYVKQLAVQDIIQESLETYKSALNPRKYEAFYKEAPVISRNIVKELPESPKTLKEAEREFETSYFEKALAESNHNISKTARKIGLRFETLHRKLKALGISAKQV
ncbi:Anaerobic nitric oxide reductase transcription regulator NorR [uncultured archaeon]|nr:Anaerobic nitric oxide reductase transcription regulator NorR [uncultured archaeon]